MAATWPSTLQQFLNDTNFQLRFGETAIRTETETGKTKIRRRFTKPVNSISASMILNKDVYTDFYDFYFTTINGGVDPFEFDDPITGVTKEYRFKESPVISRLGGENFQVTMNWEVVD